MLIIGGFELNIKNDEKIIFTGIYWFLNTFMHFDIFREIKNENKSN